MCGDTNVGSGPLSKDVKYPIRVYWFLLYFSSVSEIRRKPQALANVARDAPPLRIVDPAKRVVI